MQTRILPVDPRRTVEGEGMKMRTALLIALAMGRTGTSPVPQPFNAGLSHELLRGTPPNPGRLSKAEKKARRRARMLPSVDAALNPTREDVK